MAMAGEDSDDDLIIVKEVPAAGGRKLESFQQLLKKPKIEGGATTSAMGEATKSGDSATIRLAPWPSLSNELGFYKNKGYLKNVKSGQLLDFLPAGLVTLGIQSQDVAEFVMNYKLGVRIGVVRGKRVELSAEVVSKALKIPNFGVSWTTLMAEGYPISDCFLTPREFRSLDSTIRVAKTELVPDWREMVEFLQRWLFLDYDADCVQLGVVVVAVAVFVENITVNWAKFVAGSLHQLVVDTKLDPQGVDKEFCGGYHIMKLINGANTIDFGSVKVETEETGAQSVNHVVPAHFQSPEYFQAVARQAAQLAQLAAHPTIFEDFANLTAAQEKLQIECQVLQTKTNRLQKALTETSGESVRVADVRGQLSQRMKEALEYKAKCDALTTENVQLRLEKVNYKHQLEELPSQVQQLEQELSAHRKGKAIVSGAESIDSPPRIQRGMISGDKLLELSTFVSPAQNVEHVYTYDRQVFFLLYGVFKHQHLSAIEFQQLWQWAEEDSQEDLLVEIIVRGDVKLEDYVSAYWAMGDLGARLLRYYHQLEEVQSERHQLEAVCAEEVCWPACAVWGSEVATRLAIDWENCLVEDWKSQLHRFLNEFQSEGWLLKMVKENQARLVRTKFTDIHPSEYFYTYRDTKLQLERLVAAKTWTQLLPFEVRSTAVFKNKYNTEMTPEALLGMPASLENWSFGRVTGLADDQFLGKWENLFSNMEDRSDTLLWEALLWIGKDYNHEQAALSKPIESLIFGEPNLRLNLGEIPELVASNSYWCKSERRYKWRIDATLDTVWYNWPIIPGKWATWAECVTSYIKFWREYKNHRDSVCFRAAIFCKALAEWCQFFHIAIDPRLGGRMFQDGELYFRLNHNCCRKMRLLELMFMMQFLQGAHHNFILDKKADRKGAMESFLSRDRRGALKVERANWHALSLKCKEANREAMRRGATRPVYHMPLQWTPRCELLLIPYSVSSRSARLEETKEQKPIGTTS